MCLLLFTRKEEVTMKDGRHSGPETQGIVEAEEGSVTDKGWAQEAGFRSECRVKFIYFKATWLRYELQI